MPINSSLGDFFLFSIAESAHSVQDWSAARGMADGNLSLKKDMENRCLISRVMQNCFKGIFFVLLLTLTLIAGLIWFRVEWLQILFMVFTGYTVFLLSYGSLAGSRAESEGPEHLPFVSILVPARNEESVIEATVRSLAQLTYSRNLQPHFEILVINDASTDGTERILEGLKAAVPNLRIIKRNDREAGKGKPAVLNTGLEYARGEIIAVFDADTRVEHDFLNKVMPYFQDSKVGGVQGKVRICNADSNILTALQADEFTALWHLQQRAKDGFGGVPLLAGNGQLVRRKVLDAIKGWNEQSITEDTDLSIRMLLAGWKVRYISDAVLWQEGLRTPSGLLRQRVRWAEGLLKCAFDYLPALLRSKLALRQKLDLGMSLLRVAVSMWVWIGYIYSTLTLVQGMKFHSGIPPAMLSIVPGLLLLAMALGFYKAYAGNVRQIVVKVTRYWFYNIFWVLAVPIGLFNYIRNIKEIKWDKTAHTGEVNLKQIILQEDFNFAEELMKTT